MKKKITSKSELTEMALKSGATVTNSSGKQFNSSKKKAVKRPPPKELPKKLEPAQKKEKPVPPLNPTEADEVVALIMAMVTKRLL